MKAISLLLFLLLFSLGSYSKDQESRNDAQIKAIAGALSRQMNTDPEAVRERVRASLVSQREFIKVRLEAMSDPETAQLLARFSKVYYNALVDEGFSKEEAMRLVLSVGLPSIY